MGVVAVGRAEINIEPHKVVGMGPVHHLGRDQVFVRDQVIPPVAGGDGHVPRTKRIDLAKRLTHGDDVTGFDGLIQQDDDA